MNSEYENIDARIDALAERIELAGIGLSVMREKIESIENRALLFDPSIEHRSTTCTDAKGRININFNYF